LIKTNGYLFSNLFNIKLFSTGSFTRIKYVQSDKTFLAYNLDDNNLKLKFKVSKRMIYNLRVGIKNRIMSLSKKYHLNNIPFEQGDIIFDCGANIGEMLLWFKENKLDVNYVAFEPSLEEFTLLKENTSPNLVYNIALWSKNEDVQFFINSDDADSSIIKPKQSFSSINIQAKRLDSIIKDEKIKLLKIDAEGAEPEVLIGLGEKIKQIEYISIEVGYERGINQESTFLEVFNFMHNKSFIIESFSFKRFSVLFRNINTHFDGKVQINNPL